MDALYQIALAAAYALHAAHEYGFVNVKKGLTKAITVASFIAGAVGYLTEAAIHFIEHPVVLPTLSHFASSFSELPQYMP